MTLSKAVTGMPYRMENYSIHDMNYIIKRVQSEKFRRDAVVIYAGEEGSGKTTKMCQDAYYVAKQQQLPFSLEENFYFTPTQVIEVINAAKKPAGTPVCYDEGITGLLARLGNSRDNTDLQIMFSTCRSKRYPIFICIPRFRELPEWMAIDRSIALYEVYNKRVGDEPEHPGFYKGYDKRNKQTYWWLQKARRYDQIREKVTTTQEGMFGGWPFSERSENSPFTYSEYETYKRKCIREWGVKKRADRDWKMRQLLIVKNLEVKGWSNTEIAVLMGIHPRTVGGLLEEVHAGVLDV